VFKLTYIEGDWHWRLDSLDRRAHDQEPRQPGAGAGTERGMVIMMCALWL
jgi:hypothetical protein